MTVLMASFATSPSKSTRKWLEHIHSFAEDISFIYEFLWQLCEHFIWLETRSSTLFIHCQNANHYNCVSGILQVECCYVQPGDVDQNANHYNCVSGILQVEYCYVQPGDVDADVMTDAALMLWNRCKTILGRFQSPIISFPKCLGRIDNVGKVSSSLFLFSFLFFSYL